MSASFELLTLLGAVALLLWGLRMVRTAAERAFGSALDRHLRSLAGQRFGALGFGAAGAAILQSSTAIVLLTAGFVAKRRLPLAAGLAVALGADMGSALAAQVLALDIRQVAPLLILAGYILFRASSDKRPRNAGRALLGLGLVFLALGSIVGLAAQIRESETVTTLLATLTGEPLLAILAAALVTWLAHSSLAVVLLIASMAAAGVVEGPGALFLVLGANLGAALPAVTALLGEPVAGRQVAVGNLAFRGLGVVLLAGLASLADELLRSAGFGPAGIVLATHLGFNALVALAFIGLTGITARLLQRFYPAPPEVVLERAQPRHLDEAALEEPRRALANARREALRMADLVQEMLENSEAALAPSAGPERLAGIIAAEADVDALNSAIKFYVTELTRARLSREESRQAHSIIAFATNMEHAADIVEHNIRRLAERKRRQHLAFSDDGAAEIARLYRRLREALETAVSAFMADDEDLADQMIGEKGAFRREELAAQRQHLVRLREGNRDSIATSSIHLDLLRDLKRVHSHLTAVAYAITERGAPSG